MNTLKERTEKKNWEPSVPKTKLFSSDQLIDAYLKGVNKGLNEAQKVIIEKLKANVKTSGLNTAEVLKFLKKEKFKAKDVFLKINSWNDLDIIITVPEKQFISSKFLKVYDFIQKLEEKNTNDFYHVMFRFADYNNDFDENQLKSDGYILKYKMGKA